MAEAVGMRHTGEVTIPNEKIDAAAEYTVGLCAELADLTERVARMGRTAGGRRHESDYNAQLGALDTLRQQINTRTAVMDELVPRQDGESWAEHVAAQAEARIEDRAVA